MKIIFAILIFSIIILFHELGHFLFAKRAGIRVNEFCIGLGPTLVGFTKGETKYSIKLLDRCKFHSTLGNVNVI